MFKKFFHDLFFATTRGLSTPKRYVAVATRTAITAVILFAFLPNNFPKRFMNILRFIGAITTAFFGLSWTVGK